MLCAMDVSYTRESAQAAAVVFDDWTARLPLRETVCSVDNIAPYEPGEFFRRELPCLVRLLGRLPYLPGLMIVDGYVWLDAKGSPGLGAHLYEYLGRRIPIVGVAKAAFNGARHAIPVLRGNSRRPLHITSAGIDERDAATGIAAMHGCYRIPEMLKKADLLCKRAVL